MLNVAIIGMGKVGRIRLSCLQAIPGLNVSGFLDVSDVSISNELGLIKFATVGEILADPSIHAVMVATSNEYLATYASMALRAGKHVFCEKPPGRNLEEFNKIQEAHKENPTLTLMFGFNRRHKESIRKMFAINDSGQLGDLAWIRCRYGKELDEGFFSSWRADPKIAGGGILLDQGIHGLDLILRLMPKSDETQGIISSTLGLETGLETNAFVQLRDTKSNVGASLHSTATQWRYTFSLELSFDRGAIVLNGLRTPSGRYGDEILTVHSIDDLNHRSSEHFNYQDDDSWLTECLHFVESIRAGCQPANGSVEDARKLIIALEEVYASDKTWTRPALKSPLEDT